MVDERCEGDRELVFVWEATAYDRRGRVVATGGGANILDAKLNMVVDVPECMVERIVRVSVERVLVNWRIATEVQP
ncbi:hypothetical protein CCP3SC15_3210005 [Gammaproteobacteria bacterium]